MIVEVRYFASLADRTGCHAESVELAVFDVGEGCGPEVGRPRTGRDGRVAGSRSADVDAHGRPVGDVGGPGHGEIGLVGTEAQVGDQLLEPLDLVIELLESPNLSHAHPGEPLLPPIEHLLEIRDSYLFKLGTVTYFPATTGK